MTDVKPGQLWMVKEEKFTQFKANFHILLILREKRTTGFSELRNTTWDVLISDGTPTYIAEKWLLANWRLFSDTPLDAS